MRGACVAWGIAVGAVIRAIAMGNSGDHVWVWVCYIVISTHKIFLFDFNGNHGNQWYDRTTGANLGVVPYDTVDHWLQPATPERQTTKKRRVAKVDVLKGRTGRDVYRVGALFHHFAEKKDQLMFCSLDPGKGQDGVRDGVLREFCVGEGSCNFSSKSTTVNEGKNHAMATRAEKSFVLRVTDKLNKPNGRPGKLTHILDEWCFIPIKWCDGGGGGNTIYHSDQK